MQETNADLEKLMMPLTDTSGVSQDLGLTEKAIEVAETQAVIRDVLSITLGNIFAFFALLFPPLIASSLELTARARGLNKNPDKKSN